MEGEIWIAPYVRSGVSVAAVATDHGGDADDADHQLVIGRRRHGSDELLGRGVQLIERDAVVELGMEAVHAWDQHFQIALPAGRPTVRGSACPRRVRAN